MGSLEKRANRASRALYKEGIAPRERRASGSRQDWTPGFAPAGAGGNVPRRASSRAHISDAPLPRPHPVTKTQGVESMKRFAIAALLTLTTFAVAQAEDTKTTDASQKPAPGLAKAAAHSTQDKAMIQIDQQIQAAKVDKTKPNWRTTLSKP